MIHLPQRPLDCLLTSLTYPLISPAPIAPGRVRGVHSSRRGSSDASSPLEKSRPGPPPGLGGVRGSHLVKVRVRGRGRGRGRGRARARVRVRGSHCGAVRCSLSLRSLRLM